MKNCAIDGCENKYHSKGYCNKHYRRLKNNGNPNITLKIKNPPEKCTIVGCEKPYSAKGLCAMHRKREKTHGSPYLLFAKRQPEEAISQKTRSDLNYKFRNHVFVCNADGCNETKTEKHHEDYTNLEYFIPLCRKHHAKRDAELRRGITRKIMEG